MATVHSDPMHVLWFSIIKYNVLFRKDISGEHDDSSWASSSDDDFKQSLLPSQSLDRGRQMFCPAHLEIYRMVKLEKELHFVPIWELAIAGSQPYKMATDILGQVGRRLLNSVRTDWLLTTLHQVEVGRWVVGLVLQEQQKLSVQSQTSLLFLQTDKNPVSLLERSRRWASESCTDWSFVATVRTIERAVALPIRRDARRVVTLEHEFWTNATYKNSKINTSDLGERWAYFVNHV